jgi:hypothetical protein
MFAGMLLFATIQLAVNYKKGMVFTPFFHYGMYSAPAEIKKEYTINIVTIGGDTLRGKDFTPPQWDKIQYTLNQIIASNCDSDFYTHQVSRLFKKAGLPAPNTVLFINKRTSEAQISLYKKWLAKQLNRNSESVEVAQGTYRYQTGTFIFIHPNETLSGTNHLCP